MPITSVYMKALTPMNKAITAIFINTIISLTFLLSLVPKDITKTINKMISLLVDLLFPLHLE